MKVPPEVYNLVKSFVESSPGDEFMHNWPMVKRKDTILFIKVDKWVLEIEKRWECYQLTLEAWKVFAKIEWRFYRRLGVYNKNITITDSSLKTYVIPPTEQYLKLDEENYVLVGDLVRKFDYYLTKASRLFERL